MAEIEESGGKMPAWTGIDEDICLNKGMELRF